MKMEVKPPCWADMKNTHYIRRLRMHRLNFLLLDFWRQNSNNSDVKMTKLEDCKNMGVLQYIFQILTDSASEAHDSEEHNTPDYILVDLSLQFAAFVAWTSVIQKGFCFMT
jgi:hypothetical protein